MLAAIPKALFLWGVLDDFLGFLSNMYVLGVWGVTGDRVTDEAKLVGFSAEE